MSTYISSSLPPCPSTAWCAPGSSSPFQWCPERQWSPGPSAQQWRGPWPCPSRPPWGRSDGHNQTDRVQICVRGSCYQTSLQPLLPLLSRLEHDVAAVAVANPALQVSLMTQCSSYRLGLTWKPVERQKVSHWPGSMKALLRRLPGDISHTPHNRLKHTTSKDLLT